MTLNGAIQETIATLCSDMLRGALTAIGVIPGAARIIVIAATDAGARQAVEDQVSIPGVNRLGLADVESSNSGRLGLVVAAGGDRSDRSDEPSRQIWA